MVTLRRLKALGAVAILTVTACGALIGIDDRALDTGGFEAGTITEPGVVDTGPKPDATSATDATTDTRPITGRPVSCGTNPPLQCNAPTETCCISSAGGGNYNYACTPVAGGCPPGSGKYQLDCIDIEDCPAGQFCCGGYQGGGVGTYCKASACGGGFEYSTCDRTKTGQCTGGRTCRTQLVFGGGSSSGSTTIPLPPPPGRLPVTSNLA